MIQHKNYTEREIRAFIKSGTIILAGNIRGKIYGKLNCWSGKKMKSVNRVFFESEKDAIDNGFRPCGHCMRDAFKSKKSINTEVRGGDV